MSSEREKKLEDALAQFIKPMKGIPFEVIIKALCDVSVERFNLQEHGNQETLERIVGAMRQVCQTVQRSPIERSRPNEVGNDMEHFVIDALTEADLVAAPPRTKDGKGKSTGYPDVKIETEGVPIYLEVKTYAAKNHKTTQRSFYLSPSENPKVSEDAFHLLVGFEIERNGNFFTPVAFEIVDLYGLDCDMKTEFNSDNKRLYEDHRILVHERV